MFFGAPMKVLAHGCTWLCAASVGLCCPAGAKGAGDITSCMEMPFVHFMNQLCL